MSRYLLKKQIRKSFMGSAHTDRNRICRNEPWYNSQNLHGHWHSRCSWSYLTHPILWEASFHDNSKAWSMFTSEEEKRKENDSFESLRTRRQKRRKITGGRRRYINVRCDNIDMQKGCGATILSAELKSDFWGWRAEERNGRKMRSAFFMRFNSNKSIRACRWYWWN